LGVGVLGMEGSLHSLEEEWGGGLFPFQNHREREQRRRIDPIFGLKRRNE